MDVLRESLFGHPCVQFRKSPRFYALYDGFWLTVTLLTAAALWSSGRYFVMGAPQAWWAMAAPLFLFAFIWAQLIIHNCTHGNLPKAINRVVGELLGVLVVVRFASWDIIHMRHHKFSDDRVKDPHPNFRGFWKTVQNTIVQVEQQLFQEYFDTWGDTEKTRAAERRRAYLSYGTNLVLVLTWTLFLGPWFMLTVFAPANLIAGLFVIHFNWSTHNGERDEGFRPVNLNHGYYRVGNKLFAGIYAHANHHTRPRLFNPTHWVPATMGPMEPCVDAPPMAAPVSG